MTTPTLAKAWKPELQFRGASGFAAWLCAQPNLLFTDTRIGDLGSRLSLIELAQLAPLYISAPADVLSLECWGGNAFEAYLQKGEDPWEGLAILRRQLPQHLLQMSLSGIGAMRLEAVPDNVLRYAVRQAFSAGVDHFRIHDAFDDLGQMRLAMDEVRRCDAICDVTIHPRPGDLARCLDLARRAEKSGAHFLSLRDPYGNLSTSDTTELLRSLKQETGLPLRFHSPLPTGVRAAVDAGADVVDLLPGMNAAVSDEVDTWWRNSGLDRPCHARMSNPIRDIIDALFGDSAPHEPLDALLDELAQAISHSRSDPERLHEMDPALLPARLINLLCGAYGHPRTGFPPELCERLTLGKHTFIGRPGLSLPLADLQQELKNARQVCTRDLGERELVSLLLFPEVFATSRDPCTIPPEAVDGAAA